MNKQINIQNSQLFQELSDKEQEIVTGGHHSPMGMILYHEQNIFSYAENKTHFSDGVNQFSNHETALYSSSSKTFLFIPLFRGSRNRSMNHRSMNILFRLLGFMY